MKKIFWIFFIILFSLEASTQSIYKMIDPKSIAKLFAFYELYPNTSEGKEALNQALELLKAEKKDYAELVSLLNSNLFSFFTQQARIPSIIFSESQRQFIHKITSSLANRRLKGYQLFDIEKILMLPNEEIDLARLIFLSELGTNSKETLFLYESLMDLMALEIKARLPPNASFEKIISAMNHYLFFEKHFRFPPHTLSEKQVDTFSLLPSVLDEGKGVCMGTTLLYLCLAERLGLPLEAVTIPGHIFPRYIDKKNGTTINIETTLRGVDIPQEHYLSFDTVMVVRTKKELAGLAIMNLAAKENRLHQYEKALAVYAQAKKFLLEDPWLKELTGYHLLFIGKTKEAEKLFLEVLQNTPGKKNTILEDYFAGHTNKEAIELIFAPHDCRKNSIYEQQKKLATLIKKYPKFREGLRMYADTYLELGRTKEASKLLDQYLALDPQSMEEHYLQCLIAIERWNFIKAWNHYFALEALLKEKNLFFKKVHFLKKRLELISNPPSG